MYYIAGHGYYDGNETGEQFKQLVSDAIQYGFAESQSIVDPDVLEEFILERGATYAVAYYVNEHYVNQESKKYENLPSSPVTNFGIDNLLSGQITSTL